MARSVPPGAFNAAAALADCFADVGSLAARCALDDA